MYPLLLLLILTLYKLFLSVSMFPDYAYVFQSPRMRGVYICVIVGYFIIYHPHACFLATMYSLWERGYKQRNR
jgi:hypothetical protein